MNLIQLSQHYQHHYEFGYMNTLKDASHNLSQKCNLLTQLKITSTALQVRVATEYIYITQAHNFQQRQTNKNCQSDFFCFDLLFKFRTKICTPLRVF